MTTTLNKQNQWSFYSTSSFGSQQVGREAARENFGGLGGLKQNIPVLQNEMRKIFQRNFTNISLEARRRRRYFRRSFYPTRKCIRGFYKPLRMYIWQSQSQKIMVQIRAKKRVPFCKKRYSFSIFGKKVLLVPKKGKKKRYGSYDRLLGCFST